MTAPEQLPAAVVDLGRLALAFGRVNRITFHEDGITPESDTDHTVMLGLVACALVGHLAPWLNRGLVAQYALVHGLVEVYAGDTPTLRTPSADARAEKRRRETEAYGRIAKQFAGPLPWLPAMIADYECQILPEARFVRALDKFMPKITHIANGWATVDAQGMTAAELAARYDEQGKEIASYAADFPLLLELREQLVAMVLGLRVVTR